MVDFPFDVRSYNAKLLLFGEYTVLKGGNSLAIPIKNFSANWVFSVERKYDLMPFAYHLSKMNIGFDLEMFSVLYEKGLQFDSTIPLGYGLGSSGSITAAMVKDFCKFDDADIHLLKEKLAAAESFFHGRSSGLDPLVIYINKPILIEKGQTSSIDLKIINLEHLYLYNSGMSRSTAELVSIFNQKFEDNDEFREAALMVKVLSKRIIADLLETNKIDLFWFKEISYLQFQYFKDFIPFKINKIWKEGLVSGSYYMKLCGAGGGGFYMIYSESEARSEWLRVR